MLNDSTEILQRETPHRTDPLCRVLIPGGSRADNRGRWREVQGRRGLWGRESQRARHIIKLPILFRFVILRAVAAGDRWCGFNVSDHWFGFRVRGEYYPFLSPLYISCCLVRTSRWLYSVAASRTMAKWEDGSTTAFDMVYPVCSYVVVSLLFRTVVDHWLHREVHISLL